MFKALKSLASNFFGPGEIKMVEKPRTGGYRPIDQHYFLQPRELPPFTWWTAKMMLFDPTIRLGLRMRSAPIMATEWAYKEGDSWTPGVKADNDEIAAYVLRQLKTIWEQLDALTTAQAYGWSAAEVTYKLSRGRKVEIDELLPRQSTDTRALIQDGKPVGVRFLRVEHAEMGYVDLPIPRAVFHAHQPEAGHVYGTPILLGAYSPWADKWLSGGALDVRRLFMHADAYGGKDVRYPEGTTETPTGNVYNRDIARQAAEQLTAGGVTFLPSDVDPQTGKERWEIKRATVPANPQHILQYPKDLDTEMLRGMEIPDDVLESTEGAGGAWAGKQVPQQAFYQGLESWRGNLIRDLRPLLEALVELNFGCGRWFEVKAKPLAEQAQEQSGSGKPGQGGSKAFPPLSPSGGGFFGRMNGSGHASNGNRAPQRMSLDPEEADGRGVLDAADDAIATIRDVLAENVREGTFPPLSPSGGGFFGRMNGSGNRAPQRMSLDPMEAVGRGVLNAAELVTAANRVIRMRTSGGAHEFSSTQDLADDGREPTIEEKLTDFAEKQGKTIDQLAKETGFEHGKQLVAVSEAVKGLGHQSLGDFAKSLGFSDIKSLAKYGVTDGKHLPPMVRNAFKPAVPLNGNEKRQTAHA